MCVFCLVAEGGGGVRGRRGGCWETLADGNVIRITEIIIALL